MRVLVCGSRTWTDYEKIKSILAEMQEGTVVIEGEARGADQLAAKMAAELGFKVERFPADWDRYGKRAGSIRNQQMLVEGRPDRVVAFTASLNKSKGTKDMVTRARKVGVPVYVIGEAQATGEGALVIPPLGMV